MKVAQLLATIPEALPKEYAAELAQLQSAAPPMGRPFVRRRMAAELGPDWQSQVPAVRARGRGRRLARPGPSRHRARRPALWRASCSIRASRARSRPIWRSSG